MIPVIIASASIGLMIGFILHELFCPVHGWYWKHRKDKNDE